MKLAAVIVTYNRLEKLKKAISSILAQNIDYVVVLNNKSTDETAEWLDAEAKNDSRLIPVHSEENTGGAGGFYHGSKYAIENTDADWLLLYDDDAYPREDLVEKFREIKELDREDVGAVSTAVYMPNGDYADFNRPGINPFKSRFDLMRYFLSKSGPYLSYAQLRYANAVPVDYSSFVGCFVKRKAIENGLGYPRKEFFIYCDDWLYTLELSKLGYKNLYYSDLVFYHDSNTFIDDYDKQIWKKYYAYRNSLTFYKRASGVFFPLILITKLAKWILDSAKYKKKKEYFETVVKACKDYAKH